MESWETACADIAQILLSARKSAYKAVHSAMVHAYWEIGKLIVERDLNGNGRARYGESQLSRISERLSSEFGKGFSVRTLQQMKKFYLTFPIANALRSQLTWTHYRLLLSVEDESARKWYENEAALSGWSSRQLERQISTLYYQRMLASRDKGPVRQEAERLLSATTPEVHLHDPYVLEFLDLKDYPSLRESDLEQALISRLQEFLLELGRGFCFVARQKLMRFEDEDFYVDLVFYHAILKCYVLIDLKLGKLTHQDIGQMDSYIRMFDALYKNPDDNPTLGLILCSAKNEAVARFSVLQDSRQIFAARYQFELPTEAELQREIEAERRRLEENEGEDEPLI